MNRGPWDWCGCGHLFLLHDVEDFDGTNPTCCVDGCSGGCAQNPGPELPTDAIAGTGDSPVAAV